MEQQEIDNLIADKIALDQMYTASIKELHECKKQLILKDDSVRRLIQQCQNHLAEIEKLKKEVEEAKESQMHIIALESKDAPISPETIY
jgi:hypothetical protein